MAWCRGARKSHVEFLHFSFENPVAASPQILRGSPATFWLFSDAVFDKLSGKSFAWLYFGHILLVKAVERAAVSSHALYLGMQNFAEPFLRAQDLTPRLYLAFCFWGMGQIFWCFRWDLQRWTAAPRYHVQYFFSLNLLRSWYLVCSCSLPFQRWAEQSWATACSQGSGVPSVSHHTRTADYLSADFLKGWVWLFTNLDVFPFLGLEGPQGWVGTWVSQQ